MLQALAVLAVLELVGLAALGVARSLLGGLAGGGLAFAKPLGLVAASWLVWIGGFAGIPNRLGLALGATGLLALVSAGLWWRGRGTPAPPTTRSLALWAEGVFLAAFAAMALLVAFAPDVWGTEKPMDMAIVSALLSSERFPPHDPWMAGEDLNYYYLGHLMAALLVRLSGVDPAVGYNLALAAFYALSATTAFGLGAAAAAAADRRAVRGGLATVALVLVVGTLEAARRLIRHDGPLAEYDWFAAARAIEEVITEFPAFSWVLGDLHGHLLAIPVTLLALAFALQHILAGPRLAATLAWGAITGLLYAISAWSAPVLAGLGLLAIAAVAREHGVRRSIFHATAFLAAAVIAVAPFLATFEPAARGFGWVDGRRPFGAWLWDQLLLYGLLVWLLAAAFGAALRRADRPARVLGWGGAIVLAAGTVAAAVADLGGVVLLGALAAAALAGVLRSGAAPVERFLWLATFGGLTCLALPEVIYVRDEFDGSALFRMNTVFKFGYNAWLLLATGAAVALAISPALLPRRRARVPWLAVAGVLGLLALAFPIAGPYARTGGFAAEPRLDGLAWLDLQAPGDRGAIAWLRQHAAPDAVVLESTGDDYSSFGHARISTFTGRPTVMGWEGHELQFHHDPGQRRAGVAAAYRATTAADARAFLTRYGIDYVVVGPIERTDHGDAGVAKWDELGERIYDRDGTTVWRVGAT
jgi:YYY domain-containing protein